MRNSPTLMAMSLCPSNSEDYCNRLDPISATKFINLYRAQSVSVRSVRLAYTDKIRTNSCQSQRGYRCSDLKLSSRHPCRRAVFPLIVGELAYIRSVCSHDEELPVRLEPW